MVIVVMTIITTLIVRITLRRRIVAIVPRRTIAPLILMPLPQPQQQKQLQESQRGALRRFLLWEWCQDRNGAKFTVSFVTFGLIFPCEIRKSCQNFAVVQTSMFIHFRDLAVQEKTRVYELPSQIPCVVDDVDVARTCFRRASSGGNLGIGENLDTHSIKPSEVVSLFKESLNGKHDALSQGIFWYLKILHQGHWVKIFSRVDVFFQWHFTYFTSHVEHWSPENGGYHPWSSRSSSRARCWSWYARLVPCVDPKYVAIENHMSPKNDLKPIIYQNIDKYIYIDNFG